MYRQNCLLLRYGHLDVDKYLVAEGANVTTKSVGGFLPVHAAAQEGHLEVLKYLGGYSTVS